MQVYNTVRKLMETAASVREIADEKKTLTYQVNGATTLYLQTEQAHVTLSRWTERRIEILMALQLSVGWRYAADQDEAGVYIVAMRRPVVGSLSRAEFNLLVPTDTHVIFKLKDCAMTLNAINGQIELMPQTGALVIRG